MSRTFRLLAAASMVFGILAGCSSGGGIFQPPKSSGMIVAQQVGGAAPLSTSASNPLIVNGSFSIALSEANYSATFTAQIVSFTAQTTQSCYTVSMDPTGTIATFTPRAAPAIGGGTTTPSPCAQPGSDVEAVLFQDQQKHSNEQFFENQLPGGSGPIQVRLAGTPAVLTTSLTSPLIVSNAFVLAVSEAGYSGPFTASIASYTAPATQSCYTVSMDQTGTIATLAPRAAPAIGGSTLPSPCTPPTNDIESALFADQHGGSTQVYFENQVLTTTNPIQARLTSTGMLLSTSLANPLKVKGGFAVTLSENNYAAPFSATIVSFTAPTTESCYTVTMDPAQTTAIFTPRSAPPVGGPASPPPPSPCAQPNGDTEGVLFQDQRGNVNEQFFGT